MELRPKTPYEAWEQLRFYCSMSYDSLSAMYSGNHDELHSSARYGTFWKRNESKSRIHVPIIADIARTSADLLFSDEPRFTVFHDDTEGNETDSQKRLEQILEGSGVHALLPEAAETASAMGDVYFKCTWSKDDDMPRLSVVQPDTAIPEYILGQLKYIHFFTPVIIDREKNEWIRIYECYSEDSIHMEVFKGDSLNIGTRLPDSLIYELGYEPDIPMPVKGIAACHIPNVRPNKTFRSSMMGRADGDGLRDLCDALDETYTSWIRDIRLAKARLIVPAEYLKRSPANMLEGIAASGSWEFDPDVETYVAMDISTDSGVAPITPSQFSIRASEHAATCNELVRTILSQAGYSPQTFGVDINGHAESGTALAIREHKSSSTRDKKQLYWQRPLERLLTFVLKLDSVLYPDAGSDGEDIVRIEFNSSMGFDMGSTAQIVATLMNAQAVSDEVKIRMLHPDWSEQQINAEIERVKEKFTEQPDMTQQMDIDAILAEE